MSEIEVIEKSGHDGKRTALVLAEDRVGHYPEFREFFIRRFQWLVEVWLYPRPLRNGLFARVRWSKRRAISRRDRNLCARRRAGAPKRRRRRYRSLGVPEVDDPGHWRRMGGRGPRCNGPLVSAPVFVPTGLTDAGPLAHPFPWKMQRTNTSKCCAA